MRAPCALAPLSGGHNQAERLIPYRDAAGHEHTGRRPYQFEAKLFFVETIEKGSFSELLPEWFGALEDGSSGDLDHPIRGRMRARVLTWEVDFNAGLRGGVVVNVTWTETVDDLSAGATLADIVFSTAALAEAADADMAALNIPYPDGSSSSSLSDVAGQIDGFLTTSSLSFQGKLKQAVGTVSGLIDTVESLDDHVAIALLDNLYALWGAFKDMEEQAERLLPRPVATFIPTANTTLDAIARDVGNTVGDVMGLNLHLLVSPRVPAQTPVLYYKAA